MGSLEDSDILAEQNSKTTRSNLVISWLTYIPPSHPAPIRRRSYLLSWMLLSILFIMVISLIVMTTINESNGNRRSEYTQLIVGLVILVFLAYSMNRKGFYQVSAVLTVAIAVLGPWGSLIMDISIIQGDFVPLSYIIFSIMLSSILLRPLVTVLVAVIQILVLLTLPSFGAVTTTINWPSFLIFILFTSIFSILFNLISQRDLMQIDIQTNQLIESKAKLREETIRDPLTGLFNRRYLTETLEREVQRAHREQKPVGIIMMDIDHFKRVNDFYGHAAGDKVLTEFGRLIESHVRWADIACRYGGEEFVIVLPGASVQITRERAEQVREKVKQQNIVFMDQTLEKISISFGVAIYPDQGTTGEQVLKAADDALYLAKHQGRDRVVVAGKI